MSYADNPYQSWGLVAADATADERAGFIRKTYAHLAGAVLAFIALEAVLLNLPGLDNLMMRMSETRWGWLLVMGGFVLVATVADSWARNATSLATQYAGLALYVVAEAVIFVPLLWVAQRFAGPEVIPTAGLLTAIVFCGLTAIVFVTGADFSWLRTALMVAGLASIGLIVCSIIFGFNLGIVFSAAMIVLASGYILYDTSNVLHHYRIGQHVAAALALFAAVALLFWYMLRLVMALQSRD